MGVAVSFIVDSDEKLINCFIAEGETFKLSETSPWFFSNENGTLFISYENPNVPTDPPSHIKKPCVLGTIKNEFFNIEIRGIQKEETAVALPTISEVDVSKLPSLGDAKLNLDHYKAPPQLVVSEPKEIVEKKEQSVSRISTRVITPKSREELFKSDIRDRRTFAGIHFSLALKGAMLVFFTATIAIAFYSYFTLKLVKKDYVDTLREEQEVFTQVVGLQMKENLEEFKKDVGIITKTLEVEKDFTPKMAELLETNLKLKNYISNVDIFMIQIPDSNKILNNPAATDERFTKISSELLIQKVYSHSKQELSNGVLPNLEERSKLNLAKAVDYVSTGRHLAAGDLSFKLVGELLNVIVSVGKAVYVFNLKADFLSKNFINSEIFDSFIFTGTENIFVKSLEGLRLKVDLNQFKDSSSQRGTEIQSFESVAGLTALTTFDPNRALFHKPYFVRTLLYFFMALLLATFTGGFIAKQKLGSIAQFKKMVEDAAAGRYEHSPSSTNDEMGVLSDYFQHFTQLVSQQDKKFDSLTKVFNYEELKKRLAEYFDPSKPKATPLSLVLVDIDGFYFFNERYGHLQGDLVLEDLGVILNDCAGPNFVSRFSGDQFAIVLPKMNLDQAIGIANSIQEKINEHKFLNLTGGVALKIQCSIGIALYDGNNHFNTNAFVNTALQNLSFGRQKKSVTRIWPLI